MKVLNPNNAVSEIKGAPCTQGACFCCRVHVFLEPCTRKCMFFFEHLICHIKQGADILAGCIILRGPAPDVCIKKNLFRTPQLKLCV